MDGGVQVEGVDLTPIFAGFAAQPAAATGAGTALAAAATLLPNNVSFSQMARCPCGKTYPCTTPGIESACNSVPRNVTPFMGYSIRVENYRYNAWIPFDGTANRGEWARAERPGGGGTEYEELYSHVGDNGTDWVWKTPLLEPFDAKNEHLPRQARDKHRES